jgi:hypothetical protein
VKYTGRDDLTCWALHKNPEDIEIHDYRDYSILDADVVIHREGGVNKIVKGADVVHIFAAVFHQFSLPNGKIIIQCGHDFPHNNLKKIHWMSKS